MGLERGTTCVRSGWEADPTGTIPPHCDPLDETNTDPPHRSDMKYQRWYPTAVTLPDGRILILSGTDQDTSVGDAGASDTKVRQAVPEVYDPTTDKTVALENARKLFNMYPRSFVTQTGPGKDDWKVCVAGGAVEPPLPTVGGDPDIGGYDPFIYNGETWCLDVQAALKDPKRDEPAENHWQHIATAANAHDSGAAVRMVTINADGTWSQKVFLFGGNNGEGPGRMWRSAEMIDLSEFPGLSDRCSERIAPRSHAGSGSEQRGRPARREATRRRRQGQWRQQPATTSSTTPRTEPGRPDRVTGATPRSQHGVGPTQRRRMGDGRESGPADPRGDENLAVPVMESYQPPYFFQGPRPVIDKAPEKIHYGQNSSSTSRRGGEIASVALLRTGPITHNWTWDNQYVKLPFTKERTASCRSRPLRCRAWRSPGTTCFRCRREWRPERRQAHPTLAIRGGRGGRTTGRLGRRGGAGSRERPVHASRAGHWRGEAQARLYQCPVVAPIGLFARRIRAAYMERSHRAAYATMSSEWIAISFHLRSEKLGCRFA